MSQTSERSRGEESDNRSKQSSNVVQRRVESPGVSQQRSSSQVEQSEVSGTGDRQRNAHGLSSSNSESSDNVRVRKTVEGSKKVSSNKQQSNEGAKPYGTLTNGSQGATGGVYNAGGASFNAGGASFNAGGASFNAGGEGYSVGVGSPVVTGERRKGRFRQEQIRLPDQPQGPVRQVRQRLPTPEPDTIERTFIQRTAAEIVEEITEIPTTPPPIVRERTVVEPAGPPQVSRRTIRVPPRSGGYQQQVNTGAQFAGAQFNTGNFGATQQFAANYQPTAVGTYTGGYSGAAVGGGYQQPVSSSFGSGRSQAIPPAGCHPAFCFYL